MSAIPTDVLLEPLHEPRRPPAVPPAAAAYGFAVGILAMCLAAPFLLGLGHEGSTWSTFFVLAIGASATHTFTVRTARDSSFHTSWVFLIPAAMLLPPGQMALLGVVMHVPEWLKERYPWYMQSFNICNYTIGNLATWAVANALLDASGLIPNEDLRFAVAGAAACVTAVLANHVVLAPMMTLARGHSLRESGVFSFESLSTDFIVSTLGLAFIAFWTYNPWLIPFAVAPVLMIHRSLAIPKLQAEARVDPKTGLYNARHFAVVMQEELGRAHRFERPLSLIMADLDLLREINNSYGHLAGDAVLRGIADVFRQELRHYDVPARFGGEEFSILLPETSPDEALEIAERIRSAVAARTFEVETSSEPIRATISIGIAAYPRDGADANELVHQADLAVYRAKLQGRNRVLDAADDAVLARPETKAPRLVVLPGSGEAAPRAEARPAPQVEERPRRHTTPEPRFFAMPRRLALVVLLVGALGTAAGVAGAVLGLSTDYAGLAVIVVLAGVGEALSLEVEETGSISVSAVGALMAAAIIGPRAALPLAVAMSAVAWSARRASFHHNLFNVGIISLATLTASAVFSLHFGGPAGTGLFLAAGALAGLAFFFVNTGLLSIAVGIEGRDNFAHVWRERFAWLTPHYVTYGFIAAVVYEAYDTIGPWSVVVFALPLFLMRKTQEAYLKHTQRSAHKLRAAAETIQTQNISLEHANRLLRERSTEAMESLTATVDARDAYTAGHSRRVQRLALAVGHELGLSRDELELLGHAALFHDIGKLGIPDAILLKPGALTDDEWGMMSAHAHEGASIISRLGFLSDAVPAIRHHHERFDGGGYPDGLAGEEIPLGARIIHVADAFDSMLTTRVYRPARPASEALAELRRHAGAQFCPRCVAALETVAAAELALPAHL